MITCFFGVPGCGKTTTLTSIAQKELKRIKKGKSKYKRVCTNFYCKGCFKIDFADIGVYDICDSLILLDELTIDADNRDYKNFKKSSVEGFVLHRHYFNDIIYATQQWDAVDKKIRNLTQVLYYLNNMYILPFTVGKRIFRTCDIDEHQNELIVGYRFSTFKERFVNFIAPKKIGKLTWFTYKPKWFKYFDSYSRPLNLKSFDYVEWSE